MTKLETWTSWAVIGAIVVSMVISVSPADAQDRDAAFQYPVRAYNDGNYRVAIRGFNQFLGEYPDDPRTKQIQFWKAEAHMKLEEYRQAYDILSGLYENQPTFQPQQVLERLAFLADELGRENRMMSSFSSQALERYPKLQNYLVKWRLEGDQPQELFSELSLVPDDRLTSTAREFLDNYSRNQTVQSVEEQLYQGRWNRNIREQLDSLPTVTRNNMLTLSAKQMWDRGSHQALLRFGREVPSTWKTPEFKLYIAEAAVEKGKYDRAEQLYRELLDQPKYRAQVHFSLGWVLYEQEQYDDARDVLGEIDWAEVTEPFSAEAVRLIGDIHLQQGRPMDARRKFRAAIELSDDESFRNQTRYWMAWAFYETGNLQEANELFNNVSAEGDIRLSDVFQVRGRTALELGKYEEAINNYEQALKFVDDPQRTRTLRYELAQTFYEQGNVERAFDYLLKLSGEPLSQDLKPSVDMALGRTALEVGDHDLSWSIFRGNETDIREQFPREYLYFAGQAALEVGQLKQASTLFDTLLAEHPDSPFGRAAIRMSFRVDLRRTDLSDTRQQRRLRAKVEQSPPDMRLSLLREWGNALLEDNRFERARSIFEEVLFKANEPAEKAEAIDRIVDLELTRNQPDRAWSFVRERFSSMPVHPRSAQAVYRLLRRDYNERNLERLKEWGNRYFERFDDSPYHGHIYFMLGEIARNEDDNDRAKEYYTSSLEHNPSETISVRAHFRLGEILYDERDYEQAVELLEEVTDRTPDFVSSDRLRTMVANAYFELGNHARARAMLEAKSELTDMDRIVLAEIHLKNGELSETENYLSEISTDQRSVVRAEKQYLKGKVARQKDNLEKAENLWYETLYTYPDWDDLDRLMIDLIDLLKKTGRTEEADRLRDRLREEFPDREVMED